MKWLQDCVKYFRGYDRDNSGSVSENEFKLLYNSLKTSGWTTKSIEECLKDLDADGNKKVSFNEFIAWLRKTAANK